MTDPMPLLDRCEQLCRQHERDDLLRRLASTRRRWEAHELRLLVAGEFKQGKSLLVNALVGAPVSAVDDDIATSVPLTVAHAQEPTARLLWAAPDATSEDDLVAEEVPIATLAERLRSTDRVAGPHGRFLVAAEAGLPRRLLEDGIALIDTPGVGGLGASHAAATRATLPSAHTVLLTTDASQELTAPEVDFLTQAITHCPHVAVVLTKTDLHQEWRRVATLNQARLVDAGLGHLRQIPVSSRLRMHAAKASDASLNAESGFPDLVRFIREGVLARRAEIAGRLVRHDVEAVLESLGESLESERRVLTSPDHLPAVVAELNAARERAEDLKKRSAKWQQTLNDGVADLNSDLDHDLRDRIRAIQVEADAVIEEGDPGQAWPEFVSWLEDRTAGAIADTFTWAEQNAEWLVQRVASHFDEAAEQHLPEVGVAEVADVTGLFDRVRPIGELDSGRIGLGQKALIGMKGSYGGVLMFGILTGLAGMALVNPISVGAGLMLGGKAYRDDAAARLARRRAEAKAMVRRQLDEVVFQISKVLRDRLREVQRSVRDHFAEVADDLLAGVAESVASAKKAAQASSKDRDAMLASISRDTARIGELRREAARLGEVARKAAAPTERIAPAAPPAGPPAPAPATAGATRYGTP